MKMPDSASGDPGSRYRERYLTKYRVKLSPVKLIALNQVKGIPSRIEML